MFYRDFEVMGHAGGQPDRRRERLEHPAVLGFQPVKGHVWVPAQRRNAHQPDQLQALRSLKRGADPVHGPGIGHVDAATRHVAVETDLHIDPQRIAPAMLVQRRRHRPVQRGHHLLTVDGVRGMRPGGGTALFDALYYACRDKLGKLNEPTAVRSSSFAVRSVRSTSPLPLLLIVTVSALPP